jgi:methyl-accepting chemotaxis protein
MVNRTNLADYNNGDQDYPQPIPPPVTFPDHLYDLNSNGMGIDRDEMSANHGNGVNQKQHAHFMPSATAESTEAGMAVPSIGRNSKKNPNQTLRYQLVTRLIPGVLVPVIAAGIVGYILTSQRSSQQAERLLEKQALSTSEVASNLVKNARGIPSVVAANPLVVRAARDTSTLAISNGVSELSIEEAEQRYTTTKLLRSDATLNSYLQRTKEITGIAEIFFTDQHGFNVGYSNPTSDFVQSDEDWWQRGKSAQQPLLIHEFDESADTVGFEVAQQIINPASGEFLGVVKAVVPVDFFRQLLDLIEATGSFESAEVQILTFDREGGLVPVTTLTKAGITKGQDLLGGEVIAQRVNALSTILNTQGKDLQAAASNADFPLTVIEQQNGKLGLLSRLSHSGREYVVTTIPDTNWITVASVSRAEVTSVSRDLAILFASVCIVVGAISSGIIIRSANQLSQPLIRLTGTANQVAAGNLDIYSTVEGTSETQMLAHSFNNLVRRVRSLLQSQVAETRRSQILKDITMEITQVGNLEAIFTHFPIARVRQVLRADRVIIYRFDKTWKGTVIAESVANTWAHALGAQIHDPCFEKGCAEKYRQGHVQAVSNVYEAGLSECYLKQLEPFAVKAYLVAPIKQGEQLIGLLIAHQCSKLRVWEKLEIGFLSQVATQTGLALERCELINQKETAAKQAQLLATEQREQKEALQQQLVELLSSVEYAASGDLTVRADVTADEIGTVADFFNSIIESLRQIVTQVKQSAIQVNTSLGENEQAMRQLAEEALKQSEEALRTLSSVEQMTHSIQTVAESARQAAQVARTASETAAAGGVAMDLTVQNILSLRETVGETAKKVKRLGESSQQISKVVSLINQIALQTNLLAINASIEAARAGEEGQGFAVVAEEVGELAARSAAATQEIERIVETIQRETSQVVEAMEQSTAQVVEGTHRVEDAKQNLNRILEVSHQIDQLVQSISEATVSQVQTSKAVSSLMTEIVQASEQTSNSSRQVSKTLQQTVEIAQELQESVEAFNVGAEI